jgi:two-component system, chemotaxis family, CheB/CheR fusion protein
MMLASALRMKGYAVQSAYTGPDGLKVAQQWRPDVVLLDIGLPGLDGYEVARRLRTMPLDAADGGKTFRGRIIAVTGYGRDSDTARAREAGFDAHLAKPYEFDELEKLMTSARK